jgi:glyoxylase-like metal-dependent hydrolase (beta-lactamase superfamily II)
MSQATASQDEIRLYMMDGGTIELPAKNVTEGGEAGIVSTPVIWFYVSHPRGGVIIDGGNAAEVAVDQRTHWGKVTEMSTAVMTPEQAVVPALEALGVDLSSIRWILQTHLHLDHTGALAAIDRFPNAEVIVTKREYEWAHAPDDYTYWGYCKKDYDKPGIEWHLLEDHDDGYDVFGDGVIRCWSTPGHSAGHQSFEVNLPSGDSYLLTGDAAYTLVHLAGTSLPGFMISGPDTLRAVRKLRRLAWRAMATPIAGHDPEQWATLRHAPEYYS